MPSLTTLTVGRVFWHSLRIVIYARICIKARKYLENKFTSFKGGKILVLFALLIGSIIYQVVQKIIDKVLKIFMPLHELNPFDEFFLYDKDSPANASMIFRMEKFPFEKYRNFIRNV